MRHSMYILLEANRVGGTTIGTVSLGDTDDRSVGLQDF